MKKKAEIEIARRAYEYLLYLPGTIPQNCVRLGLDRKIAYRWYHNGMAPSARSLQALALDGADVHYILTGHKKGDQNEHKTD